MKAFFPKLDDKEAAQLEALLVKKKAPVGTVLMELGTTDRDLYLLKDGACEVYQKFRIGDKLFALRVGGLRGPVVLGEANLLLGEKRHATILVSKDLEYYRLSHAAYTQMKAEYPQLSIKVLEELGKVASRRFLGIQQNMMERFLAQEPMVSKGLAYLRKFMGNVHPCSPKLAQKLFSMEQPPVEGDVPPKGNPPYHYDD